VNDMAKKANVRACPTEKEQAAVSKKERAETNRINVMSFIKTPPKNFPPQCNTIVRECFLIVDVDTSKSDQWSSTSQKWPTTIIERVKTRESAESKARRKHLPEGHVAIALSTEEYNMLDTRHFNRLQRLSEVVSPKTREEKIQEESRLARKFTDLPVEPLKKRMTRQEEEAVFARVGGLESQIQTIGTHAKGQSVYTPSKKTRRQSFELKQEEIPSKLLTRAEKASRRQEYELKGKEIPMELLTRGEKEKRLQELKLSKQREERFHGTCTKKCFVIVIRDQNSGMVALYKPLYLHDPITYETEKEAEKDRKILLGEIGIKKCNTTITTIDDFKRHYDPSDVVEMEDLFGVCKIKLA